MDPAEPYLAAAVCAGAVASLILCPMEETRIRLLSDPEFASGLLDGLPRLLKEDGVLSPFKGLPPMLSKQIPYTAAKQVSFDVAAGAIYSALGAYAANLAFGVEVAAAFSASVVACIMSHPGDVLLTASYKSKENGAGGFLQRYLTFMTEVVSRLSFGVSMPGSYTWVSSSPLNLSFMIRSSKRWV